MLQIKCFSFTTLQSHCIVASDESGQALVVDPSCWDGTERGVLDKYIKDNGLTVSKILLTHAHFDHVYGVSAVADKYDVPVLMDPADKVILENNYQFCNAFGLPVPDNSFAGLPQGDPSSAAPAAGTDTAAVPVPAADTAAPTPAAGTDIPAAPAAHSSGCAPTGTPAPKSRLLPLADGDKIEWGQGRVWEVISTPGHTPGGVCFLDREAKLLVSGDTLFAGSIGRTDNQWGDYDQLMKSIMDKLIVLDSDIAVIPGHGPSTTIGDESAKNPFLQPFNLPFFDGLE